MTRNLAQSDARFHSALAQALEEQVEFPLGLLVTLVQTHMTPDSKHVTGTLSVLPAGREADVLQAVRSFEGEIKSALGQLLRMRRMPQLHWRFDDTEEEAAKIEADLNTLKARGEL
jgi:ribosome-binding factor A